MYVATTVNASCEKSFSDEELAYFVKKKIFPDDRMYVLFTECPLQDILKLYKAYEIDLKTLKEYYDQFIKPRYINQEPEGLFSIYVK